MLLYFLFIRKGVWKCEGLESGMSFTLVEFEGGEWVDYDEKVRPYPTTIANVF